MPSTISCLIIDDEAPSRDELLFLLSKIEGVTISGDADTPKSAIKKIYETQPDLIFLDIQMPGGSGFDVLVAIKDMDNPPLVVFATAFDQYAVRAFDENALDYILKPFEEHRVCAAVDRAMDQVDLGPHKKAEDMTKLISAASSVPAFQRIPVSHKGRIRLLDPADIVYVTIKDKQTVILTSSSAYDTHTNPSLDTLELRLSSGLFFRPHRQFLINLDQVKEFYPWFNGRYEIVMNTASDDKVPVSKSRVRAFKEILGI